MEYLEEVRFTQVPRTVVEQEVKEVRYVRGAMKKFAAELYDRTVVNFNNALAVDAELLSDNDIASLHTLVRKKDSKARFRSKVYGRTRLMWVALEKQL